MRSRRANRPLSAAELVRFLDFAAEIARADLEMGLEAGAFDGWHLAETPDEDGPDNNAADPDPSGHFASCMTVSQAIRLLGRLDRAVERLAGEAAAKGPPRGVNPK